MKLIKIIDILGWYSDSVNNVEKELAEAVKQVTEWEKDAKKYRESLIKRCPECSNDVTEDWNFCRKCGWDGLCHA